MENHTLNAHGIKQHQKALGVLLRLMIKECMLMALMNGEFAEKVVQLNVSENNLKVFFLQYEIYDIMKSVVHFYI